MGGGMGGGKGGGQSDTGERVRNVIDGEVVNNRRPRPGGGLPPGAAGTRTTRCGWR